MQSLRAFLIRYYLGAALTVYLLAAGIELLVHSVRPFANEGAVWLYHRVVKPVAEFDAEFTLTRNLQLLYAFEGLITLLLALWLSLWLFEDAEVQK